MTSRSSCTSSAAQFPWLAVVHKGDIAGDEGAVGLYNFPNPHFLKARLPDGIPKDKIICGSSLGWMSILDRAGTLTLNNPFTGRHIKLPPFANLPLAPEFRKFAQETGDFLCAAFKLISSSDPLTSPTNCVVMGLMRYEQRFVFLLPGSARWIVTPSLPDDHFAFQDIAFYKGCFFAVSLLRLFLCDPASHDAPVVEIPSVDLPLDDGWEKEGYRQKSHLVESDGELLLVSCTIEKRYDYKYGGCAGYACKVYRVELSGGRMRLRRINHLGGRLLFLGGNSMSVSAAALPGCKPNQIYYIDISSRPQGHPDHGSTFETTGNKIVVLDVEDGTHTTTIPTLTDDTNGYWWSAYWLTPSL